VQVVEIVNLSRLGMNETSSVITEWFVSQGDEVHEEDALFSVGIDKSTLTVYAESLGVILKRLYDENAVVEVMTPARIGTGVNPAQVHAEHVDGFNVFAVIDAVKRKKDIIITPAYALESDFFPQPDWFLDAYHQKTKPLPEYWPLRSFSVTELIRQKRNGGSPPIKDREAR
jgi:pyruvate/2-oxoglutarate dehydrogenase complex dihydrolipoamide acyltransferase (E2) component